MVRESARFSKTVLLHRVVPTELLARRLDRAHGVDAHLAVSAPTAHTTHCGTWDLFRMEVCARPGRPLPSLKFAVDP